MPIYEYICEDCQAHFEKIVLNKTQEIACPEVRGEEERDSAFGFQRGEWIGQRRFGQILRWIHGWWQFAVAADVAATDRGRSARAMLISHSLPDFVRHWAAILLVIPGPAVTYVVSRSIGYGRAAVSFPSWAL